MEDKKILLDNIEKIHTTEMGIDRIRRNLKIDTVDVVAYCKNKVLDKNCNIYKQGKNWYCEVENIKITINSYSYTIITAHIDNDTPSLAMSVCSKYRGLWIGTSLLEQLLQVEKLAGYSKISLSVQKSNYAVKMYKKVGFNIIEENSEEYIMIANL